MDDLEDAIRGTHKLVKALVGSNNELHERLDGIEQMLNRGITSSVAADKANAELLPDMVNGKRSTYWLDEATRNKAKLLGHGNVSLGIRIAVHKVTF